MPAKPLSRSVVGKGDRAASGWVVIDPRYRRRFVRRGLLTAADFIDLPGEIVSGHANRHIVRVVLGRGLSRMVCYLKREHRVPWRERLRNFFAGYGWVSKSEREVRTLNGLRQIGVPVPRWLAYGEDGDGRAFVLVRAVSGSMELRTFLIGERPASRRRELARRLGCVLARVHSGGFDTPDLSSKHVLIQKRDSQPVLIDWQRTVQTRRVRWGVRVRSLALLHSTIADDLASPRERLACLRAYLQAALGPQPALRPWVKIILRRSAKMLRHRSIHELRRLPLARTAQRLRWIDGESLAVTRPLWRAYRGRIPDWLTAAAHTPVAEYRESELSWRGCTVVLRQLPPMSRWRRWCNWLCGRHEVASGPRLGGELFREERNGIAGPRPLAFGQRPDGGSFILLQPGDGSSEPEALRCRGRDVQIAFCHENVLPARGGAETYVADFIRRLVAERHDVHLYACRWDPAALPAGLTIHPLPAPHGSRAMRPWRFSASVRAALDRDRPEVSIGFDKTFGPDIYYPLGGLQPASATGNLRKHGSTLARAAARAAKTLDPAHRSFARLERRSLLSPKAPMLVVNSAMVRRHAEQYFGIRPERVRVIHNAIDPARFVEQDRPRIRAEERRRLGLGSTDVIAAFIAMNYRLKGLEPLLHAMTRLPTAMKLLVAGSAKIGPWQRRATRLGVADRVIFLGPAADVRRVYFASDLHVHPTFYDPCSGVVIEALACGLPVVTSRFNGAAELMRPPHDGVVVDDPHDHAALAAAIGQFLDPVHRDSASRAARRSAASWTIEHHYRRWLDVFAEVAERRRAA